MRISVIGLGYLGAVHAAALASLGHDVVGLDTDAARISLLSRGEVPFYEPGLAELLKQGNDAGSLTFTTDPAQLAEAEVHFLCVGTPQSKTANTADLTFLFTAVVSLKPFIKQGSLVVGKSTVPVGTADTVAELLHGTGALVAWNPEFLRQGTAVQDSLAPDRLVYGVEEGHVGEQASRMLDGVYAPLLHGGTPRITSNFATAELIKVSANAFLALKLSYINAVGELCDQVGADVVHLAEALGHDGRIGASYLQAGVGFGGGCLPKDLRSLRAQAHQHGVESLDEMFSLVDGINADARFRTAEAAVRLCGGTVDGCRVTILGASFKPHTDDIRDSPALDVAGQLAAQGAVVTVCDPKVAEGAWLQYPQVAFERSIEAAMCGAELVVLLTQWPEFLALDPATAFRWVDRAVIVDGRNALDAAAWRASGWQYHGTGRGSATAPAQFQPAVTRRR